MSLDISHVVRLVNLRRKLAHISYRLILRDEKQPTDHSFTFPKSAIVCAPLRGFSFLTRPGEWIWFHQFVNCSWSTGWVKKSFTLLYQMDSNKSISFCNNKSKQMLRLREEERELDLYDNGSIIYLFYLFSVVFRRQMGSFFCKKIISSSCR